MDINPGFISDFYQLNLFFVKEHNFQNIIINNLYFWSVRQVRLLRTISLTSNNLLKPEPKVSSLKKFRNICSCLTQKTRGRAAWLILFYRRFIQAQNNFAWMKIKITTIMANRNCVIIMYRAEREEEEATYLTTLLLQCWFFPNIAWNTTRMIIRSSD